MLPSLGKTEHKIKNHNDNPADIQVDCLFPQHDKPKKTTTTMLGNKKLIKNKPAAVAFRGVSPHSRKIDCDYF